MAAFKARLITFCVFGGLLYSAQLSAEQRQYIRFYKINKKEQTTRMMFANKKGKQAGCHDFLKKTRIYRVNQLGFANCKLYARKNCETESLIEVNRAKDETPVTELTQGYSWLPVSENPRGVKLHSWDCQGSASSAVEDIVKEAK